jgi:hypothetical protein
MRNCWDLKAHDVVHMLVGCNDLKVRPVFNNMRWGVVKFVPRGALGPQD